MSLPDGTRHVVWDWNGTLLDDVELCRSTLNTLLERRGLPPVSAEFHAEGFGFPLQPYYESVGFDFAQESFSEVSRQFTELYEEGRHECPLRIGAREIITALNERGVGQSVLSAYNQHLLRNILNERDLAPHFSHITGTDNLNAEGKVARGLAWLEESGLPADEVLLIGDTLHDVEVARALGVKVLLVESGHQSRPRLESAGCPVLPGLAYLLNGVHLPG